MLKANTFEPLGKRQELQRKRLHHLSKLVKTWEGSIRQALNHLAQVLWPSKYILGFIPVRTYRLRYQQLSPEVHIWWVERDIPPYDRYNCAAYRVYLILNPQGPPGLMVQSGNTVYPVNRPDLEVLETTVAQAGYDPPLVIPRHMGKVKY